MIYDEKKALFAFNQPRIKFVYLKNKDFIFDARFK